jgi:hypothetical protein
MARSARGSEVGNGIGQSLTMLGLCLGCRGGRD